MSSNSYIVAVGFIGWGLIPKCFCMSQFRQDLNFNQSLSLKKACGCLYCPRLLFEVGKNSVSWCYSMMIWTSTNTRAATVRAKNYSAIVDNITQQPLIWKTSNNNNGRLYNIQQQHAPQIWQRQSAMLGNIAYYSITKHYS
jgi:hypothetical protein